MTHPRQRTGSRPHGGLPVRCETGHRTLDNQPPAHHAPAEMDTGNDEMTHPRQLTGSRPQGGLPVSWARTATWTLVLGAALALSAPPPAGWAAAGATAATPTVAPEPPRYTLVSLGTLGGGTSKALAINERGEIVGDSSRADGSTHGFLWRNGKMADLGVLAGGDFSSAQGINDRGEIVGVSGIEEARAPPLSGATVSCERWGRCRADGSASASRSMPEARSSASRSRATATGRSRGRTRTMRDLGILPGGSFSLARGINDRGVIVGQADAADGTIHATRWANGRVEDLGQITTGSGAPAASIAYAVGPDGLVVGYGTTDSGALGAVWTGAKPRPAAALSGYAVAQLLSVNSFRQAVGDATDSAEDRQIAVIVDLRRVPKSIPALFDLNTLVTNGAGWTIRSGADVNDSWAIVGTGHLRRARTRRPSVPPLAVTVERTGTGVGSVTGSSSIACGRRCIARLAPGASVTLRARPAEGSRFVRWQGACAGTKPVCSRAVDGALAVRAVFARVPTPCHCVSITTAASLQGTARTSTGTVRVRLVLDWHMHCAAGTDARCQGRLHLVAPRNAIELVSPAGGSVGCEGACAPSGDRVVVGRTEAVVEVRPPPNGPTVVTLLVQKSCLRGGRSHEVGVDRVELALTSAG